MGWLGKQPDFHPATPSLPLHFKQGGAENRVRKLMGWGKDREIT